MCFACSLNSFFFFLLFILDGEKNERRRGENEETDGELDLTPANSTHAELGPRSAINIVSLRGKTQGDREEESEVEKTSILFLSLPPHGMTTAVVLKRRIDYPRARVDYTRQRSE